MRVSPPRGEEEVGETEETLGVSEESYSKLPPVMSKYAWPLKLSIKYSTCSQKTILTNLEEL